VAYDFVKGEPVRDRDEKLVRCFPDQPGMLIARIDTGHPIAAYDGYVDEQESSSRVLRSGFEEGDAWFVTGDVLRTDAEGNYWFVDRATEMVRTEKGPVSSVHVEDVLYELPEVKHAVVVGLEIPGSVHEFPVAFVVVREGYQLDASTLARHVQKRLDANACPRFVKTIDTVEMSVGYRPLKQPLRERGIQESDEGCLRYDAEHHLYEPLTPANFAESLRQLGGRAVPRATKSMPPRAPKSKAPPPGESASKPKSKAKEMPAG
jgi:acyl-CoA synthetase (AMP-forming)/AMP-acid ligase II